MKRALLVALLVGCGPMPESATDDADAVDASVPAAQPVPRPQDAPPPGGTIRFPGAHDHGALKEQRYTHTPVYQCHCWRP